MIKNFNYEDYDDIDFLMSQNYYHGTTDKINIEDTILPSCETGIDREEKKSKKVWVTTSLGSAQRYSHKAADKFGGNPVVYEVEPDWDSLVHRMDYEYICDFATIIREI